MGIYSDYGVEYGGYDLNGTYITLIPLKIFENRLIQSTYYVQRKKFYETHYGATWSIKIETIDIELSEEERALIRTTSLTDHGFFDVAKVQSTL
jgi:hypothetical protein